jgi:hypothetical protein
VALLGGRFAQRYGAPDTVLAGGIGCLLGAAAFALGLGELREAIRPIYRRIGILPPAPETV